MFVLDSDITPGGSEECRPEDTGSRHLGCPVCQAFLVDVGVAVVSTSLCCGHRRVTHTSMSHDDPMGT